MDQANSSAFDPSSVRPYGPACSAKPTKTAHGSSNKLAGELKRNARNFADAL
jgi:hypothetical protein